MKYLTNIIIGLLCIGIVFAVPELPITWYGKMTYNDNPVVQEEVCLKNLRTYEQIRTNTDNAGFFFFDLNALMDGVKIFSSPRDILRVGYCGTDDPKNYKDVEVLNDLPRRIDIVLGTAPAEPVRVLCPNGAVVSSLDECPIVVTTTAPPVTVIEVVPTYVCADGTQVNDASLCPESNDSWWMWITGLLAAAFALFGAGGWQFYNGKFRHSHRGIVGYHDPNTKHTNVAYRHTIWKVSPLKCMADVKKIQQGIKLG